MKERNRLFPSKSKLAPSSPTTPLSVRADSALARCGRVVATPESRSKRVAQVQGKVLLFQTPTSKKILCAEIGDRGETASSKQLCGGAGEGLLVRRKQNTKRSWRRRSTRVRDLEDVSIGMSQGCSPQGCRRAEEIWGPSCQRCDTCQARAREKSRVCASPCCDSDQRNAIETC